MNKPTTRLANQMAILEDILRPEAVETLKPLAERLGAVRAELDSGVIIIKTVYGPAVELGRGATMVQAVDDVMKNAREHARNTNGRSTNHEQ